MSRIEPVSPPYTPEQEARIGTFKVGETMVPPLAIFRTFASHPELQDAMKSLGRFYLRSGAGGAASITLRDREVVIDRVCARCGCEYEWGVHIAFFGEQVELTAPQVTATVRGDASDPAWPERDRLLIRLVDELHDDASISESLWLALAAVWSRAQLLELLILAGWYHAIAYLANGIKLDFEPWAPTFPAR